MPFASLHALVVREETGVVGMVRADGPTPWHLRIELVRGWVHAISVEDSLGEDSLVGDSADVAPPRNEKERRALAAALEARAQAVLAHRGYVGATLEQLSAPQRFHQLLLASVRTGHQARLLAEPRSQRGNVTPFHPQRAMRSVIHELVAPVEKEVDALVAATTRQRMVLTSTLHRSGLDPDDEWAVSLLARGLDWEQLLSRSRCAPSRLVRLLREAAILGSLQIDDAPPLRGDIMALVLDPVRLAALAADKRREYHRKARELHPDLHPGADSSEKAARTDAMAELATRHKKR